VRFDVDDLVFGDVDTSALGCFRRDQIDTMVFEAVAQDSECPGVKASNAN
jgi:hypothetical protein